MCRALGLSCVEGVPKWHAKMACQSGMPKWRYGCRNDMLEVAYVVYNRVQVLQNQ